MTTGLINGMEKVRACASACRCSPCVTSSASNIVPSDLVCPVQWLHRHQVKSGMTRWLISAKLLFNDSRLTAEMTWDLYVLIEMKIYHIVHDALMTRKFCS